MTKEQYDYFADQIWFAALEVHREFGPGLLELPYRMALMKEFELRNINVQSQVKVPLFYKGNNLGKELFIDILVENEIVLELKACDQGLHSIHHAQLLSYLRLSNKKLGFLINFNSVLLKNGYKRLVKNY